MKKVVVKKFNKLRESGLEKLIAEHLEKGYEIQHSYITPYRSESIAGVYVFVLKGSFE